MSTKIKGGNRKDVCKYVRIYIRTEAAVQRKREIGYLYINTRNSPFISVECVTHR